MVYNTDPHILTIEISTAGCKVAIASLAGVIINSEFNKLNFTYPINGGSELNLDELWSLILKTMTDALNRSQLDRGQFAAICCSSSCEGMAPVDRDGNPLKNAVIWNDWQLDKDEFSVFQGWKSTVGVGLQKIQRWAKLHEGETFPGAEIPSVQLLLFKNLFPDLYKKTYKLVNILDFVNSKLSGRLVSTPDSDLRKWITDNRNPIFEVFSQDLIRDRGFNEDKVNEVVPNTAVIGELKTEIAVQMNLPLGVKIIAGGSAIVTSAFGAGAIEDNQPFYYLGSSSWFAVHLPIMPKRKLAGVQINPSVVPGKFLLTSNQPAATANLNYLRDMVFFPGDELSGSVPPEDTFQIMDRMAVKTPVGSNGLLYFPWLKGINGQKSGYYPHAVIFNLTTSHTRSDIVRAVMEGVALNSKRLIDPVESVVGTSFTRLNISGGGAKSNVWCQIFADVLEIPIRQVSDPGNVNSRGAALISAVGLGYLSYEDAARVVQYQTIFSPRVDHREDYDRMYDEFLTFYKRVIDKYPQK